MKAATKNFREVRHVEESYSSFDQLDGTHPWGQQVPEGMILYPVRQLSGGKVSYAKIAAARLLGLPVIILAPVPATESAVSIDQIERQILTLVG